MAILTRFWWSGCRRETETVTEIALLQSEERVYAKSLQFSLKRIMVTNHHQKGGLLEISSRSSHSTSWAALLVLHIQAF